MKRPPEVEEEIANLRGHPGSTECGQYLRHLIQNSTTLRPETLVYIIREARIARCSEQDQLACRLLTGLQADGAIRGGHGEAIIRKAARRGRFIKDDERLQDFRQRVWGLVFQQIRGDRSKYSIWEQRFFYAFRRRVLEVVETFSAQAERDRAFDSLDTPGGAELSCLGLPLDELLLQKMSREQLLSLVMALEGNPGRAFYLRYIEDRPIKGDGGIAELLGVGDRMVRNYLSEAKQILSRDPVAIAIRDDIRSA